MGDSMDWVRICKGHPEIMARRPPFYRSRHLDRNLGYAWPIFAQDPRSPVCVKWRRGRGNRIRDYDRKGAAWRVDGAPAILEGAPEIAGAAPPCTRPLRPAHNRDYGGANLINSHPRLHGV